MNKGLFTDDNRIPEVLCGYFDNGNLGMRFVPETWREGCASLWLDGGGGVEKTYVDGSRIMNVPFEVRLRCDGRSIRDRLDAIAFFGRVSDYAEACPLGEDCRISVTSCPTKAAVYDNGEEEYRGTYVLRYKKQERKN